MLDLPGARAIRTRPVPRNAGVPAHAVDVRGGARKLLAYLLVLATYLTLPAAFGAYGDTIGFSVTGTIVVLSVACLVVILWLLGRRKTT